MESEMQRTARLEAIAAVHAIHEGRDGDLDVLLNGSEDPLELAHAACALAASVLVLSGLPVSAVLKHLADAAVILDYPPLDTQEGQP